MKNLDRERAITIVMPFGAPKRTNPSAQMETVRKRESVAQLDLVSIARE